MVSDHPVRRVEFRQRTPIDPLIVAEVVLYGDVKREPTPISHRN